MGGAWRQSRAGDCADLAPNAPYAERADRQPSRVDDALLSAWGRLSAHVFSKMERRRLQSLVDSARSGEREMRSLSERRLREQAEELRTALPRSGFAAAVVGRVFALAREAASRRLGMRHYEVQLIGGAAMMRGALAEMETGEGKTLTALLPAVVAALARRPVHVITVNNYLARRDAEQLRPAYDALGLTVGVVEPGQDPQQRRAAYACDVTYCTNKDIVFDYLRDRLALGERRARTRHLIAELLMPGEQLQKQAPLLLRGLHFAIVDEADSVLIDEARTPLILSGRDEWQADETALYGKALETALALVPGEDFQLLANENTLRLNAAGEQRLAELASERDGIWAIRRAREELVQQALCALHLYRRDANYIVADGKVQIVDEYTGRILPDRSWERGLHQLIEMKEGCALTPRRSTLARITYQRFFRRYLHLCGMTGTAMETAGELRTVYGLKVVRIPTNRPLDRRNLGGRCFATVAQEHDAVVARAQAMIRRGRAVLIGTRSVASSECLGERLRQAGLEAVILNARQDREEAEIVARAGQPGQITVATNMAGRGTDIVPHRDVAAAGGLHVILTEYHELERVDRQLFGRGGRQGDPGSYEAIVALDNELFQRYGGELLLRICSGAAAGELPGFLLALLHWRCQAAAERLHAGARRRALVEDYRLQRALGFAGTAE